MNKVEFQDWGRVPYQEAWDRQTQLHKSVIARKLENRKKEKEGLPTETQQHYLLFCEHPPVYTLGKSGSLDHLLLDEQQLEEAGFEFYKINRGGDITYHGPGQIVGYPIFDLDCFFTDVHKYVRYLEEAVMRMLSDYGIESYREEGFTGVWLKPKGNLPKRKICAIGVHLSRWVTMHGFALNVNPSLDHFSNIVPCGIADDDKEVTSMAKELGQYLNIEEVKEKLKQHFAHLFEFDYA
jgi:lipoyl(octanoyl) transferase